MEKKGVCFARKFILAVGVFFLLLILPAVNAEAKEVSLVKGDAIRYMGPIIITWMVIWHFVWSQI